MRTRDISDAICKRAASREAIITCTASVRAIVTVRQTSVDKATFRKRIGRETVRSKRDVGVFVHGYNTKVPEALFHLAQLSADTQPNTAPVLFA